MPRDREIVHKTMSRIRGKNTGIERKLRKALTEKGIRYRLYSNDVIGHPDLLLKKEKIAIFADSEFWHGYHYEEAIEKVKTNKDFWVAKIQRNMDRDREVNAALEAQGYLVLRYWGFEIERELPRVVDDILFHIKERREIFDNIDHIEKKDHTTLIYLYRGDEMLLLYRNKEKGDINEGKYLGVGGHLEEGETPLQCAKREVKEETGLTLKKARYLGELLFLNTECPSERIYVYKGLEYEGEIGDCNEGDLRFVKKDEAIHLPMWEGDKLFFPLLLEEEKKPPFHLIVLYEGSNLVGHIGPYYNQAKPKKKKKKRVLQGKRKKKEKKA